MTWILSRVRSNGGIADLFADIFDVSDQFALLIADEIGLVDVRSRVDPRHADVKFSIKKSFGYAQQPARYNDEALLIKGGSYMALSTLVILIHFHGGGKWKF